MSEMPNQEKQNEPETEEKTENGEESSWGKDQKKKSYYYDDSYGYEVYNPDEEE